MLELLDYVLPAWRVILAISELTGLAVGALAAIALIVWFVWPARAVRTVLVFIAMVILVAYVAVLYGLELGRAEVRAEWDADKVRAAEEAKARDATIATATEQKYGPAIAEQERADKAANQVNANEREILAAIAGGDRCRLGPEPLRLRSPPAKRR